MHRGIVHIYGQWIRSCIGKEPSVCSLERSWYLLARICYFIWMIADFVPGYPFHSTTMIRRLTKGQVVPNVVKKDWWQLIALFRGHLSLYVKRFIFFLMES